MWLARGAIAACLVLLVLINTIGFGEVTSVRYGNATIYSSFPTRSVFGGALGILACVAGVVFWMQPGRLFTFFSILLFLCGIFAFLNVATGFNHRVVVTPDYFYRRVGAWYSPVEVEIHFEDVIYLDVVETKVGRGDRRYELQCTTRPNGHLIAVPVFDMMKKALPEIIDNAKAHDVMIGENADRWRIPADLSN